VRISYMFKLYSKGLEMLKNIVSCIWMHVDMIIGIIFIIDEAESSGSTLQLSIPMRSSKKLKVTKFHKYILLRWIDTASHLSIRSVFLPFVEAPRLISSVFKFVTVQTSYLSAMLTFCIPDKTAAPPMYGECHYDVTMCVMNVFTLRNI
jgi:hypothetical protein